MKHQTSPLFPVGGYGRSRKFILFFFILLGFTKASYADVNSLTWAHNLKGYSIEQVPGTNEYVAAGTVYEPMYAGYNGTHFLRLDANGNVLFSRIMWNAVGYNNNYESWNVVDIAVEDVDKYWITYQVRGKWAGQEKDYLHANRVDGNGNSAFSPPLYRWWMHYMANGETYHSNMYPTHTIWHDHALYICGYAAHRTEYPNDPHHAYSDKAGFILKYDDITGSVTPYFWNSGSGETDFDMALKMRLTDDKKQIMLTGAMNIVPGCPSGVLVMLYDLNVVLQKWNGVISGYYVCYSDPYTDFGYYGMDMWEDGTAEGGYFVLANYEFLGNSQSWGVLHVRNNLTIDPSVNNFMYYRSSNRSFWGHQVFHGPGNSMTIVGEETDLGCSATLPSPNLQPSAANVNPFMINCKWGWGPGGIGNTFNWNRMQPSALGTQATGKDYLSGNLIEDVTRLYTFTTQVNNDPNGDLVMINPVVDPSGNDLNIKFTSVDASGYENMCGQTQDDCATFDSWPSWDIGRFQSMFVEGSDIPYPTYYGQYYDPLPTEYDCTTGNYKTAETGKGIQNIADLQKKMANNGHIAADGASGFSYKLFPNPVKDEVNLIFDKPVSDYTELKFVLCDIMGKEVFRQEHIKGEGFGVSLKLPALSSGVYMATISNGEMQRSEKVIVK